jgi:hypothetical protein
MKNNKNPGSTHEILSSRQLGDYKYFGNKVDNITKNFNFQVSDGIMTGYSKTKRLDFYDNLKKKFDMGTPLEYNEVLYPDSNGFYFYLDLDCCIEGSREFDQGFETEYINFIMSKLDKSRKYHRASCARPSQGKKNSFKYSYRVVGDFWFESKKDMLLWIYDQSDLINYIDKSVYNKKANKIRCVYCKKQCTDETHDKNDQYYQRAFTPMNTESKPVDFLISSNNKFYFQSGMSLNEMGPYCHGKNIKYNDIDNKMNRKSETSDDLIYEILMRSPAIKKEDIPSELQKRIEKKERNDDFIQDLGWTEQEYKYWDHFLGTIDKKIFTDYSSWIRFVFAICSKGITNRSRDMIHKYSKLADNYDEKSVDRLINGFKPDSDSGIKSIRSLLQYRDPSKKLLKTPRRPINEYQKMSTLDTKFKNISVVSDSLEKCNPGLDNLPEKFIILNSNTGTGKSKLISKIINKEGLRVLDISSRISLCKEHLSKMDNMSLYSDHTGSELIKKNRLVITPNSIHKIDPEMEYDIIVLDEINSVIEHIIGKTIKNPTDVLERIHGFISKAKKVIMCDAIISDLVYEFVLDMNNGKYSDIIIVNNSFIRPRVNKCQFFSDKKALIKKIENNVGIKKMLIFSDSKRVAKNIKKIINLKNKETDCKLYCADSSSDDLSLFSLSDKQIKDRNLKRYSDIMVCSPSITYGLSIEGKDIFDEIYCIYENKSIDIESQYQQISRLRDDKPVFIYASANYDKIQIDKLNIRVVPKEPLYKTYEECKNYHYDLLKLDCTLHERFNTEYKYGKTEIPDSLINRLHLLSLLYTEKSRCEPKYYLRELLESKGYEFREDDRTTEEKDLLSGALKLVKLHDLEVIDNAVSEFLDNISGDTRIIDDAIGKPLRYMECNENWRSRINKLNIDYVYDTVIGKKEKDYKNIMCARVLFGAELKTQGIIKTIPEYISDVSGRCELINLMNECFGTVPFMNLNSMPVVNLDHLKDGIDLLNIAKKRLFIEKFRDSELKGKSFTQSLWIIKTRIETQILNSIGLLENSQIRINGIKQRYYGINETKIDLFKQVFMNLDIPVDNKTVYFNPDQKNKKCNAKISEN